MLKVNRIGLNYWFCSRLRQNVVGTKWTQGQPGLNRSPLGYTACGRWIQSLSANKSTRPRGTGQARTRVQGIGNFNARVRLSRLSLKFQDHALKNVETGKMILQCAEWRLSLVRTFICSERGTQLARKWLLPLIDFLEPLSIDWLLNFHLPTNRWLEINNDVPGRVGPGR